MTSPREAVRRGLVYFAVVFGAGFVLGPIRVLWLVPRIGERWAELLEAPVMLAVIVVAARWVVARFPADQPHAHLGSGLLALAVLLAVELGVVSTLRGGSVVEYVRQRDPVAGAVYGVLLVVFALMPWLLSARRREHHRGGEGDREERS